MSKLVVGEIEDADGSNPFSITSISSALESVLLIFLTSSGPEFAG